MKWKSLKRGLAIVLSALMITSSASVYAEEPQSPQPRTEADGSVESTQDSESRADGESRPEESAPDEGSEPEEGSETPAESEPGESKPGDDSETPTESKPATETEPTETPGTETPGVTETEPTETPETKPTETETTGKTETETTETTETETTGKTETEASEPTETETTGKTETETPGTTETKTTGETETESTQVTETEMIVEETTETENETETETETETKTQEIVVFADIQDVVTFNTGNLAISVIPSDDYSDELFEACLDDNIYVVPFDEDGNFTIEAEADAFFPYEVQFQYDGKIENRWFLSPYDRTTVGGHTFCIRSEFSGDVITQMSLGAAGKTITVYPQEKEFTNDGGISAYSLLPLEERELTIDLRGLTPMELTMVSMNVYAGSSQIKDTDDIVWKLLDDSYDDYKVSVSGGRVDLSSSTYLADTVMWEIIAGKADQLAAGNIRYLVTAQVTSSWNWLEPDIYCQDESGNRTKIRVVKSSHALVGSGHYDKERHLFYVIPSVSDIGDNKTIYVGLKINTDVFASTSYSKIEAYGRLYNTIDELRNDSQSGNYLLGNFFDADMTQKDAGIARIWQKQGTESGAMGGIGSIITCTLVTYDQNGTVTGCLPIETYLNYSNYSFDFGFNLLGEDNERKGSGYQIGTTGKYREHSITLWPGNLAGSTYYLELFYYEDMTPHNEKVTAAYVGDYESIAEARSAGAADIKNQLFDSGGYAADYSGEGIRFSIFVGEDGSENQMKHYCIFKVKEGETAGSVLADPRTYVRFDGLKDAAQQDIPCYSVDVMEDSYAEYNYLTMIVGKDVDLTNVAPTFMTAEGIRLYAGTESQESGKKYHNFANGPVQYTAASSDGTRQKNYWLQIVKAQEGTKLYVNSLADTESGTKAENGVITSTREVHMDKAHDQIHDILLINMGTAPIEKISAELQSDWLELDSYWQLKGDYDLSGFTTTQKAEHGELSNMAKLRLKVKDRSVLTGTGVLTIKSNGNTIMRFNLTGTDVEAHITTTQAEIDRILAVKYVPYGLMVQNDNKYGLNQPSYSLKSGTLPEGMSIRTNGELYGVPQEEGTFTFRVLMTNSSSSKSDEKEYTITVQENTDENIEKATDEEYVILDRMPDVGSPTLYDKVIRSKGEFKYFDEDGAVYIDGRKLIRNVDYTASDGSTRIVIRAETLDKLEDGWHTLGIEFRNENKQLKRVAQNFRKGSDVVETPPPDEEKVKPSESNTDTSSNAAVDVPAAPTEPVKLPPVFVDMDGNIIRGWSEAVIAGYQAALRTWLEAGGTGRMVVSINAVGATDLVIPEAVVRMMAESGADYHIFLDNMVIILTSETLSLIQGEIDLNFRQSRIKDFGEGFDALILDTEKRNAWVSPVLAHLVLDQEKAGQEAYVFAVSELTGQYELVETQDISTIGTICFDIAMYTSIMILY